MKPQEIRPLVSKHYTGDQILNPARPYVRSVETDIRVTFDRVRKAQQQAQPAQPVSKKMRRVK